MVINQLADGQPWYSLDISTHKGLCYRCIKIEFDKPRHKGWYLSKLQYLITLLQASENVYLLLCLVIVLFQAYTQEKQSTNTDSTVIPYEYDGRRTDGVRRTQTYTASVFAVREQ